MCGFVGVFNHRPLSETTEQEELIKQMNRLIVHRGPDDEGYFHDEHVGFGFRRLSIIDVEHGKQPLSYEDEKYWIIFNGEIYNYVELKEELVKKGYTFSTDSDTEVLLATYRHYKEEAASKLRGMFAFLIWDKEAQLLYGARDPFGIKPLYFTQMDEQVYFASERKSLMAVSENILFDETSLQQYMSFQFVPEPNTLDQKVHKVEPGHQFTLRPGQEIEFKTYWKVQFKPEQTQEQKLIEEVRDAIYDSVKIHMRSDVPVGSFLSGGIDSSFIVSVAKEFHPELKTFSVGFQQDGFSEVDVAKETADKLGLQNFSAVISPEEYMNELPKIVWHLDDPLADPAAIPLYFVAKEAKKQVTVVLSGEGADELFGGYNIYREPLSLKPFESVPSMLKKLLLRLARLMPEGMKGKSFIVRGCTPLEERYIGNAKIFEEPVKKNLLKQYDPNITYRDVTKTYFEESAGYSDINKMQYVDIHTWMRGDILLKADKMTMANSLELRVPFLDKVVFEAASKIPEELKTKDGTTKYLLRKAAEGIVPDHVLNRKKLGFPVPIRHWLKNEMNAWAKDIIKNSQTDEYINKAYVLDLLNEHCAGKADHSRKIWTVLIFMIWHSIYVERSIDPEQLNHQPKEVIFS
ncbi:asparagine synthase (glutamine-hydrolyzing) [Bacillus safensis]|uniref:asparagine synthase (glutamine-hydrolyzing) n=1 Tax=Bacillus TaxID=1386 RepID=UPI00042914ED|nr:MULTISPECIES: asparagine synthase (glutamine-hydrolyzing) [Bacillus]APJ12221.1 asparagine synthase (glutamine-hydrolyzing) [Bacillus safensis]KAB3535958.1 asparagine synthase (glutamine-hydrolyzing) [Bacillus safensis]KAB3543016.1 asparagine synthase (glutamine-hydrolyzing) [Bacillus safensis]MBR0605381.1 asparagine synthase (glutamine-hydrolyzing) [Bacillus safensis]MBS4744496.1 asparagine synthetase B [Bacillus safensis]